MHGPCTAAWHGPECAPASSYELSLSPRLPFDPRLVASVGPLNLSLRDGTGSGSGRILAGFRSCEFGFEDGFSPTVFGFGFGIGFGFGFGFSPVDIQWISEINHLELKLMFYNMLIITCLLRLLNLFKIDS
jgi:hypothetical protein